MKPIIKEEEFRRLLKKGLSGAYLFAGDEDYLKSFSLKSARSTVCAEPSFAIFNDIQIDPINYSPEALVNALMPLPMMDEKKIVSINGLPIGNMRSTEIDELIEAISTIEEYDYNILIISVPAGLIDTNKYSASSGAFQKLAEVMTTVLFEPISGAKLTAWVSKHFTYHGVNADSAVCNLLIDKCNHSMFSLANETEKLAYYALQAKRTTVTADDVENIACTVISSEAFALANAIIDGRNADAIEALSVMKYERIEPVIVLSEVSKTINDLFLIKVLSEDALPTTEIARILKQKSEYRVRMYAAIAAKKSKTSLYRAIALCSEADLSLKNSSLGYTAIERLICYL